MGNNNSSESNGGMNEHCWNIGFTEAYNGINIMTTTADFGDTLGVALCTTNESWNKSFADGYVAGVEARGDGWATGINAGDVIKSNSYPSGTSNAQIEQLSKDLQSNKDPLNVGSSLVSLNVISKEQYDKCIGYYKEHGNDLNNLSAFLRIEVKINNLEKFVRSNRIDKIRDLLCYYNKHNHENYSALIRAMQKYGRWNEYFDKYQRPHSRS